MYKPILQEYDSIGQNGEILLKRDHNNKLILTLRSHYCGSPERTYDISGELFESEDINIYVNKLVSKADEVARKMKEKYKY